MTSPSNVHDDSLQWQHAPRRALISLAWPIVISLVSYSAMTVVDTWFVSHLGPAALAGTGFGGTLSFIAMCFPLGLTRALKTLISQSIGAGKAAETQAYLAAGLIGALAQSVVVVTGGELLCHALASISASAAAAEHAERYLSIRLLGTFSVLLGSVLQETRVALGDSRSAMRATVIANVFHVGIAYLLIFTLDCGVAGAAWATVVSQYLETGLLALAQRRDGYCLRTLRAAHWRALWAMGWPTAMQFVLEFGSFALLSVMLASFGELDMAAHQIGIQVQHFAFMPALALGEAASVLCARAVGAGQPAMVHRIARNALQIAVAHTALCTLVLAFGAAPIAALFTHATELGRLTEHVFHIACLFMVADACNIVARCSLRGTGDVRVPALVGIASAWLMTPPLTWLLGRVLGWGVVGAWFGLTCEIVLGAVILWRRLRSDAWRDQAAHSQGRVRAGAVLPA